MTQELAALVDHVTACGECRRTRDSNIEFCSIAYVLGVLLSLTVRR